MLIAATSSTYWYTYLRIGTGVMPKSDVGTNANNEIFFSEVTIPRSANKMLTLNPIANNAKRERAAQSAQRQQTHGKSASQGVCFAGTCPPGMCVGGL